MTSLRYFRQHSLLSPVWAVAVNLLLAFAIYVVARLAFLLENYALLHPALQSDLPRLLTGCWMFDASAIAYTNALWVLLMLLPVPGKDTAAYHRFCKALFLVVAGLSLTVNLADAVYFPYTLRRTTTTVFREFSAEGNLAVVIGVEMLRHWYLVLLAVALLWGTARLYIKPQPTGGSGSPWPYVATMTLATIVAAAFTVAAMRGGWSTAVRPITISNSGQYVSRPTDAALVLNTPFAMIRTVGKDVFHDPAYFPQQTLSTVYDPVHRPHPDGPMQRRNVVVLIVESFAREYIGAYNRTLDGGTYRGYTPCIDSLIARSVTFSHTYCNGRKSIDGMPSVLSAIPMFIEPFFLTPASMNHVSGIADLLSRQGWQTAFFHGAQNGSMGFEAFARNTGFKNYFGRTEYERDVADGHKDFDGTWAIWDDPFLQYFCRQMSAMREPFMTAVFTASSHHPFVVPAHMADSLPEGPLPIHRCIRYTDAALGHFFASASRQPWFRNTLFVLTSDHTNMSDHDVYRTDLGGFCSPIIFYDPSGELLPEPTIIDAVAQHTDILPTVMGLLRYPNPYVAFGCDLFATPAPQTWAVNYLNGIYQYVQNGYVLQFDGQQTVGLYALTDSLMQRNIKDRLPVQTAMEQRLKGIIQQYMHRMTTDSLTVF